MSGGRLGATTGQQSQQLGRTGCGEEENEDKLEPAGTSMSVVTITNPLQLQRAMAADLLLLPKSQATVFFNQL